MRRAVGNIVDDVNAKRMQANANLARLANMVISLFFIKYTIRSICETVSILKEERFFPQNPICGEAFCVENMTLGPSSMFIDSKVSLTECSPHQEYIIYIV